MKMFFLNKYPRWKKLFAIAVLINLGGCMTVRLPKLKIFENKAETQPLTWQQIVSTTAKHNPDLRQARFEVDSKARSRDIAFGDYLPTVDGSFDRSRQHNSASKASGSAAEKSKDAMSLGVSVEQPLFTGFKTTAEFLKAKKEWEAAKFDYLQTSAAVRFNLRSAYAELLRQYRFAVVNPKIAKRRHTNAEMIRLRYEAGREHMGSLMRVEAIANQADFEVRQAERQIENKSILLSRQMGGEFVLPIKVEGNLEELVSHIPDTKPDIALLAEETPTVKSQIKIAESLKASIASAQSDIWPQVSGTYDYGITGPRASDMPDSFNVALNVLVPFFHGGKNIQGIRKAKSDYNAAFEQAKSVRDQAVADLTNTWILLVNAKELVSVRKDLLDAALKRADIVRTEYETGLASFQDFDTAEQEFTNAERDYINSLGDTLIQEANWELTKGSTLESFNL